MVSAATTMALKAVGQMLVMLFAGMYVAHMGYLDRKNLRNVSKLVMGLFTPSLLFSNLSAGTSLAMLSTAAVLPIVAFSLCGCGLLLGYVARKTFLRKALHRGNHGKLFQSACIVGNSQGLPLVLTSALVPAAQWTEVVSYISFYIVSVHIVTWFGVYNWLKQDVQDSESDDEGGEDSPLLNVDFKATPKQDDVNGRDAVSSFQMLSSSPIVERFKDSINPPLIAVALGLFFGLFHPIHHQFARDGAPFQWVHDAIARVGQGMVPCVMTIMGASMYHSLHEERENKLSIGAVLTITAIRLMILPAVGIVYVSLFGAFLPPMLCLTILVEACTPTANNVTVILSRLGIDPAPLGPVYIFQYLVSIPLYAVYLSYALELSGHSTTPPPVLSERSVMFLGLYVQ